VTGKWSLYDFLPPKNLTNVSSQTSSTDISNVPPPKSNTAIFSSFFLLKP
jgi:hypothetical protein